MAEPPSRPALRERYDRRRKEVIDTAAEVFAASGYHATSMQDLAEATGLAAGGLYHYIGGKEELLVAICDELMAPLLARAREIVDADGGPSRGPAARPRARLGRARRASPPPTSSSSSRNAISSSAGPSGARCGRPAARSSGCWTRCSRAASSRAPSPSPTGGWRCSPCSAWSTTRRCGSGPRGRLGPEQVADGFVDLLLGKR